MYGNCKWVQRGLARIWLRLESDSGTARNMPWARLLGQSSGGRDQHFSVGLCPLRLRRGLIVLEG